MGRRTRRPNPRRQGGQAMHTTFLVRSLLAGMATLALLGPSGALAAGVRPLFDLDRPATAPFPSDRFTLPDTDQLTGRRVDLPAPDCPTTPSQGQEARGINSAHRVKSQ